MKNKKKRNISQIRQKQLGKGIIAILSKLQSYLTTDGHMNKQKQIIKSIKLTKKQKKENINTGHWSAIEHTTYVDFLSQYENIMNKSIMKKTSKIVKQMSELIGTHSPSQCRSHHQKFNPYSLSGNNGKRLLRFQRSRAGRKKKLIFNNIIIDQLMDNDLHNYTYEKQNYYNPFIIDYQFNEQESCNKCQQNQMIQNQIEYEDYLKLDRIIPIIQNIELYQDILIQLIYQKQPKIQKFYQLMY